MDLKATPREKYYYKQVGPDVILKDAEKYGTGRALSDWQEWSTGYVRNEITPEMTKRQIAINNEVLETVERVQNIPLAETIKSLLELVINEYGGHSIYQNINITKGTVTGFWNEKGEFVRGKGDEYHTITISWAGTKLTGQISDTIVSRNSTIESEDKGAFIFVNKNESRDVLIGFDETQVIRQENNVHRLVHPFMAQVKEHGVKLRSAEKQKNKEFDELNPDGWRYRSDIKKVSQSTEDNVEREKTLYAYYITLWEALGKTIDDAYVEEIVKLKRENSLLGKITVGIKNLLGVKNNSDKELI